MRQKSLLSWGAMVFSVPNSLESLWAIQALRVFEFKDLFRLIFWTWCHFCFQHYCCMLCACHHYIPGIIQLSCPIKCTCSMQVQFTFQWNSKGIQPDNVHGGFFYFISGRKGPNVQWKTHQNICLHFSEKFCCQYHQLYFHILVKSLLHLESL